VKREHLRNGVVAVLGVVAVALGALALPSARQNDSSGQGGSGLLGSGDGLYTDGGDASYALFDLGWFKAFLTVVAIVCLIVLLRVLLEDWARVGVALAALVFVVFFYQMIFVFSPAADPYDVEINESGVPSSTPTSTPAPPASGAQAGGASGAPGLPGTELLVAGLVLCVAIVGVAVVAWRQRRATRATDGTDEDTAQAAAVGRAAGRAADRIEASGLDNEVYRAWGEMTQLLDVSDPETNTPREFEHAAVDAGMERADVEALTDLFERIRYGGYAADSADEQHAVELLGHIESTYTEDDE